MDESSYLQKSLTVSFRDIEKELGYPATEPSVDDDYPLPAWYLSIREKPLADFSVEDICKSCRQEIHVEYIVPLALHMLRRDSMAGELYEGELLVSI